VILNRVLQLRNLVLGIYWSKSTSLGVVYKNKRPNQGNDAAKAHLDVKGIFEVMEVLDIRKGRK
jgi:hypothetical protein